MQQFNIFQAIFMSFYSKRLYRDVATNWGGKAFLYLFVLLILVSLYFGFALQAITKTAYQEIYTKLSPQVPVITIKEGKLSTPENRPYLIIDPDTKKNLVVIDTSGQYKTNVDANASALITENQIFIQQKKNETRIYSIPENVEGVFDAQYVNDKINQYVGYSWIAFFILGLIAFYIYRVLQALVYAILGKIFAVIIKAPVSYFQIVQIMLVAITPAIIIYTIQLSLQYSMPYEALFYFLLSMFYLFYGIKANK